MRNKRYFIIVLIFCFCFSTSSYAQNPFGELDINADENESVDISTFHALMMESDSRKFLNQPYNEKGLYPIHYYMKAFSFYLVYKATETDPLLPKYYEGLTYLIENGPDLNFVPENKFVPSPLLFACNPSYSFDKSGLGKEYAKLIKYGADFYKQSPDLYLFSNIGPKVKKKDREIFSPLQFIIAFGDLKILSDLSEAGIKFDAVPEGWEGASPMSFALEQTARDEDSPWRVPNSYLMDVYTNLIYFDESFKIMHQLGGSLNHRIYKQHTSLYEIANYDMAKYMIENGVDIEQPCPVCNQETLLHRVSWIESVEKAKLLVNAGANVNAIDDNGKSPLMWALENDNADLAVLLIKAGASTSIVDTKGKSVQDYERYISALVGTELEDLLSLTNN